MGRTRIGKGQEGLTLVEVLMGVVILGAAVAPAAFLLSGDLQGLEIREEATRSLYLAQGKMEEIRALDYDDLTAGTSLSSWVTLPDSVYIEVNVTLNPGGTFDTNMKKISVTSGIVTLNTYRTNALEP